MLKNGTTATAMIKSGKSRSMTHWHTNPLLPPDGSHDGADGFISIALLVFVIIAPLIYFGHELGMVESWLVDAYRTIEGWLQPVRDWLVA